MYHTSPGTRVLSTLGAGTLGLLVLAGPTPAVGDDTDAANLRDGNVVVQNSDLQRYPDDWRRPLNQIDTPPTTTTEPGRGADPGPVADQGSLEYLQIALGGLAGATVAAALGLRRRHHLASRP